MIKITKNDDGTTTVALPAYLFEVSNQEGTPEALVEEILERVREELEDHFGLDVSFIHEGEA